MRIEKAPDTGFCCGVRRAIDTLKKAARDHSEIETLGPVVHNRQVVDSLAGAGIHNVDCLANVRGKVVAITAHGTDPATLDALRARNLNVIDTTCAIVKAAQKAVTRLAKDGYGIVIFGDPQHPEVAGLLGWAGNGAIATTNAEDLAVWKGFARRVGVLAQSTQSRAAYRRFITRLLEILPMTALEIHIVNSICNVTHERLNAAGELATRSDLMLVIGGRNSANTRRLAEACSSTTPTHHIETTAEIRRSWLAGKHHVGIVAGTSTPDSVIDAVETKVRALAGARS